MEIKMFDISKFGGGLSRLRKNADMTQSELADKLNLTRQAISKYENGDSFPDIAVLVQIAEIFGVTVDTLINAGEPTADEAKILHDMAVGAEDVRAQSISSIVGVAPLLKPSVLDKLSACLSKQNVDISHIVELAEYLSDDGVKNMIDNMDSDTIEPTLLSKLAPLLDDTSILAIFQKILDGNMPVENLKIIRPYAKFLDTMIEAAVVEGALPWEALSILHPDGWEHQVNGDTVIK